ncbi:MAG: hypothetical protein N2558_04695 [Patescibacteria group bacterium]|nr:hypothetical protein [Patescibacteria group bacterium]
MDRIKIEMPLETAKILVEYLAKLNFSLSKKIREYEQSVDQIVLTFSDIDAEKE